MHFRFSSLPGKAQGSPHVYQVQRVHYVLDFFKRISMRCRVSSFLILLNVHDQIKVASHNNFFTFKGEEMIEKILEKSRIVIVRCINDNQS